MSPYIGYDSDTTFLPGTVNTSSSLTIQGGGITQTGGDVNFDSGTLFIDEDLNRVGIGTTSPSSNLQIVRNADPIESNGSLINLKHFTSNSAYPYVGISLDHYCENAGLNQGGAFIQVSNNGTQEALIQYDDDIGVNNGLLIKNNTDGPIYFQTNGANERLRISSTGNVGIGTTNPSEKLHVYGDSTNILIAAASGVGKLRLTRGATATEIYASTTASYIGTTSDTHFGIRSNNIEGIRVDSAGSVGIGAIPETSLSSDTKQLKVGGLTYIRGTNGTTGKQNFFTGLLYNAAPTSSQSDKAIVSNASSDFLPAQYAMYQGAHRWRNATSATAGEAITWVDQMIITNSGNVGIGTTNPSTKLQVQSGGILVKGAASPNINFEPAGVLGNADISFNGTTFNLVSNSSSADLVLSTFSTERFRISSTGNVGIGTTNPVRKLQVGAFAGTPEIVIAAGTTGAPALLFGDGPTGSDAYRGFVRYDHSTNSLDFATNATSRLIIDSSGNTKPTVDATYNLGSPTARWANIYSADLQLSNEGSPTGNDIDGTWGAYTIQEGEEALYLINRRSGKKFKFVLEEVK